MATPFQLRQAVRLLTHGGIIAYPTEAVYGLGCDPDNAAAVLHLLALKQRSWRKGVILIASSLEQLAPYIVPLNGAQLERIGTSWPGPNTWVVPARPGAPVWITGDRATIAVRVTDHPVAAALCDEFGGALVSTSANLAGRPPARTPLTIQRSLHSDVALTLHGPLGGLRQPTTIRDVDSGRILRTG